MPTAVAASAWSSRFASSATARHWYLVARDVDRRAWRTYRVDRLSGAQPTGHRFQHVDPPDPVALVGEGMSTAPYRHQARLVIDAPLAAVADRVPPTVATLEAASASTTVLVTGADDLDVIALHVALLGFRFTVVEPAELVDRAHELGARLLAANGAAPGPQVSPGASAARG